MTPFTDLVSTSSPNDADTIRFTITDDWAQGRTTYGGLTAALCLQTALRRFPDLPPLRSANVAFVGPAGGVVEARATELRRGRSVSFVEADLMGEKGLATRCVFAFGAKRESMLDHIWTPAPDVPAPTACAPGAPADRAPGFLKHFDIRLAKGAPPASGSTEHDHFFWVKHREGAVAGIVALVALADVPPPAALALASEFHPISSMTWMFNVVSDAPQSRDGWWLLQMRGEHAADGYSSQDMLVWNSDMELVLAGRQSVALFF